MTKRRKWDAQKKAKIVLEGIKGRPVAEICNEYQISQSMYYAWRDMFLSNMGSAFDQKQQDSREAYLKKENKKLKSLVGELTIELKKNEEDW